MVNYSDLNDQQKLAVVSDAKQLRIVAGAGSGKTRVLTMRICYLITEKNVRPSNILAITFTNKAAKEMKVRIDQMLGDLGSGSWISTIHSLCVRILHEDIEALGYPRNFTIVDQEDQHSILKEAYKLYNLEKKEYPFGSMLDYIANNKCEFIDPEKAMTFTYGEEKLINKAKVYDYYTKRLNDIYGLDFDDLILYTIKLFKKEPDLLNKWANKFHYVHVDEFQDVDKLQYELCRMLSSVHKNLYVVGDPDQTIYTWRGADVNIIVNFDRDYPNSETIILNQNYRSTNNILKGSNSVIRNNKARVEKELFSTSGDGEKIKHKTFNDETGEAYFVAKKIKEYYEDGMKYSDMAVLYRSNYLSREVEKALIEKNIPYIIYGGIRFYERMEVKDILSYLRLIVNGDDLSFKRVINQPKRGLGDKTIDAIYEIAQTNGITMYEAIKLGTYPKNKETFSNFVDMIEGFREELKTASLEVLLQDVLNKTGYRAMLEKDMETERLENVKALIDDIKEYQENYPESTLADYLQMISLYLDKASEKIMDSVNLLTIHSAKGLEFDTVFVVGVSEGIFPSERSLVEGQKGLEEERRLAYVAYTRAKKNLYLTESSSFSYVTQSMKTQSRFIREIDPQYVEDLNETARAQAAVQIFDSSIRDRVTAQPPNRVSYRAGDKVEHTVYGEGVVLDCKDNIVSIAFPHPIGIKKIFAGHASLSKIDPSKFS